MSYIIIVGGELRNKGAQAMTFTVVNEIKSLYPNKKIILLDNNFSVEEKQANEYLNFDILPFPFKTKISLLGWRYIKDIGVKDYLKFILKGPGINKEEIENLKYYLNKTELILDISGYALSSQRGYRASLSYLFNIMIAKKYNIPVKLLPQSFGPFDYNSKQKNFILNNIKKYLNYPETIFARERDGLISLENLGLKNVVGGNDIVLSSTKEYKNDYIFSVLNSNNVSHAIDIKKNSIAIIPNERIMTKENKTTYYNMYKEIIEFLLKKEKNVYLLRHSKEDLIICQNVKKMFEYNEKVKLVEEDLNCIELNNIIKEFDFIVGSRYHSIIHAYKNKVPALVFGWAIKYKELLSMFSQEQYLFDVRTNVKMEIVLETLQDLLKNYPTESKVINESFLNLNNRTSLEKILL